MTRLAPCPACTRHVKVGSASCPFCGGAVPLNIPRRRFSVPGGRSLTRAAALFAGAAAVTACGEVAPSPVTTTIDSSAPVPAYGVAAVWDAGIRTPDAGTQSPDTGSGNDADSAEDAGDDVWWSPVEYGPSTGFFDAGFDSGSIPDAEAQDVGQGMAAYGGFVTPDGGH